MEFAAWAGPLEQRRKVLEQWDEYVNEQLS